MTISRPSAALRSDPPPGDETSRVPSGRVVPFTPAARPRRRPAACEPRGEILLFLGVRYEHAAS